MYFQIKMLFKIAAAREKRRRINKLVYVDLI